MIYHHSHKIEPRLLSKEETRQGTTTTNNEQEQVPLKTSAKLVQELL
jgi:hypothetical protein